MIFAILLWNLLHVLDGCLCGLRPDFGQFDMVSGQTSSKPNQARPHRIGGGWARTPTGQTRTHQDRTGAECVKRPDVVNMTAAFCGDLCV